MLNKLKLFGLPAGAGLMIAGQALQSFFMPKTDNIFGATWCVDPSKTVSNNLLATHNAGHCVGCFTLVLGAVVIAFTLFLITKHSLELAKRRPLRIALLK